MDSESKAMDGDRLLRRSFVCHADILGWSDRSCKAIRDGSAEEFVQSVRSAYRWVRSEALNPFIKEAPPFYNVRTFTDNLVVSHELHSPDYDAGEPEFASMLSVFQMYQALLSSKGFPVRGAIAEGMHYMDNDFAFGDALVEAVKMEKSGGPPRIVLAPSVMGLVKRHLRFYAGYIEDTPHYSSLLIDNDGLVFLDYLAVAFSIFPEGPIWFDLLADHKDVIEKNLKETLMLPRVHEKYRWMAGYHNYVCSRFVEGSKNIVTDDEDFDRDIYEESLKVSDFLIDNIGFPEPQVLPQSLKDNAP